MSAMASDLNIAVAPAEAMPKQARSEAGWPDTRLVHEVNGTVRLQLFFRSLGGLVIFSIGAVVLIWMVFTAVDFMYAIKNSSGMSSAGKNAVPANSPAAVPTVPTVPVVPVVRKQAPSLPFDAHGLQVEPAPIGTGHVLSKSQLRYCLILKIRIEAGLTLAMPNHETIDLFNTYVDAHNSRCLNYLYSKSELRIVAEEVERQRQAFVADALADFAPHAIDFSDLPRSKQRSK